jgi:hypothetical protein
MTSGYIVRPREKGVEGFTKQARVVVLNLENLRPFFRLPLSYAAMILGIGETALKM